MAAVEFFPSPITATLLAFLGRFSSGFALREDLGDYDLLNPSSAARRKQVLLEEGWPRGELPSKVGLREHMQARAALRYKVGLVYHGNAAETGEYLYDPNYTPTRDIEQVVHTLRAMFKPTSVEPELGQGL